MRQICFSARKVVIDDQNLITFFKKLFSEMRAKKASATSDEDFVLQ